MSDVVGCVDLHKYLLYKMGAVVRNLEIEYSEATDPMC